MSESRKLGLVIASSVLTAAIMQIGFQGQPLESSLHTFLGESSENIRTTAIDQMGDWRAEDRQLRWLK